MAECVRGLLAFVACPAFGKLSDVFGRKGCLFVTVLGTCAPVCSLAFMSLLKNGDGDGNGNGNGNMMIYDDAYMYQNRVWIFVILLALSGIFSGTFTLTFAYISDTINTSSSTRSGVGRLSSSEAKKEKVTAYGLALATFGLSFTIGPMLGGYLANVNVDDVVDTGAYTDANVDADADADAGYYNNTAHYRYRYLNTLEDVDEGNGVEADISINNNMDVNGNGNHDTVNDLYTGHYLHPIGQQRVFCTSLVLTILDLLYIYFLLPESLSVQQAGPNVGIKQSNFSNTDERTRTTQFGRGGGGGFASSMVSPPSSPSRSHWDDDDGVSVMTNDTRTSAATIGEQWNQIKHSIHHSWSPWDTLAVFSSDPFLQEVGYIAFLYYTSLWAVVSTLTLYAAKRFHMGPARLGELMSLFGFSTMISEAILVRFIVPAIGEKKSMRIGLLAFSLQCIVLGFAYEGWQLFICVLFSMLANLVYPSLTSLVSSAVAPDMVGEALGAVNGIKALTEGVGPLVFGMLMTFSEHSVLPGWPYFLASGFAIAAYRRGAYLPDEGDEGDDDVYLSERYWRNKNRNRNRNRNNEDRNLQKQTPEEGDGGTLLSRIMTKLRPHDHSNQHPCHGLEMRRSSRERELEQEYVGLLSEVEGIDELDVLRTNRQSMSTSIAASDTDVDIDIDARR